VLRTKETLRRILCASALAWIDVVPELGDGVTTSRAMACANGRPRRAVVHWPP